MAIVLKDDLYDAIRGYKYQHCPVLSGLNKTQLGELVNKFDLNVRPTGSRNRPDGTGAGRNWNVNPKRKKPTWESKPNRTRDIKGMDVRFTGLLDKTKPVQTKRKEVAEADAIKGDILKKISRRAGKPKVEKPKMKLRFKKK